MIYRRYVLGAIRRRPAESLASAVALAIVIAFITALGSFVAQTGSRLTRTAAARVPVDWQVQLAPNANPGAVTTAIRATPGYIASREVDYAQVPGLQAQTASGLRTTGRAYIIAIPNDYPTLAPSQLRPLLGSGTGIRLLQQTAANLGATLGSQVAVTGIAAPITVTGIVDLPDAGTFFQVVGAPAGSVAGPAPDNVVFVPPSEFARAIGGAAVVQQIHVQLDHRTLPSDPARAADTIRQRAAHLSSVLAGQALIGDNLEATLSAAREDAIFARLVVLLLGIPGVALAGVVGVLVLSLRNARQGRDLALLRLRGASPQRCAGLLGLIATVDGIFEQHAGPRVPGLPPAGRWARVCR